ncbi:MAG: DnaJ domain-containing protein [Bdellovibrionaceae bacterium]|nr:DnaJ domain-containing protein [Pseudobdellovibrionaceae bacterium]
MFNEQQTFYDILEISTTSSADEILKAYLKSKETYSTDSAALYSMFTKEEAYELLKLVEEAYTVLSNPISREQYDAKIQPQLKQEELPDISYNEVQEQNWKSEASFSDTAHSSKNQQLTETVPEGFKKTKFGVYEVKQEMEDEIKNAQFFDGPFLQKIRLYKNVTTDQVIKNIRISRSYLQAIECNDYEVLPATVFIRGFLVQFSKILELDEKKVAGTYLELYKSTLE